MVKYLFVFLFISFPGFAQEQEISVQKNKLSSLRDEIKHLELEIKEKSKKEKQTFETVEKMKKQVHMLNSLINQLKKEEEEKQNQINSSVSKIERLEKEIYSLRESYARSIRGLYKYGKPGDLDLFLNSDNVNQALVRKKYIKTMSLKRQSDINRLNENITELSSVKAQLIKERNEKTLLAAEKQSEETNIKNKISENHKLIASLKKNRTELKKEIDSKRKAERKISELINKLIAEAERKKKAEMERLAAIEKNKNKAGITIESPSTDFDLNTAGLSSFKSMKGKLNWPLKGKIKTKFGENRNPLLNTITLNYGVDIEAGKDNNVICVADGIVSAIEWIPGYGSVIIVTHSEDFRTVYSRLSEIYITEGEKIKAGKLIARVGESIEGNILHFEIWSSRNNQNPEIWLARK